MIAVHNAELITEGKEMLFRKLDSFSFGSMGENIGIGSEGEHISTFR